MAIRSGSKTNNAYNPEVDLEYTEYLLIEILIICGYTSYNLDEITIDEAILKIREIFNIDMSTINLASNDFIAIMSSILTSNYRRYWFNRQTIKGVIGNG